MPHLPAQILWTYYERMGDVKLFVFSVVFELRSCRSVAPYYAPTENDTAKVCRGSALTPTTAGRLCENFNRGEDKRGSTKTKTEGLAVTTIYGYGRGFDSGRRTADVTGVR